MILKENILAAVRLINHGGARAKADQFGDCYGR